MEPGRESQTAGHLPSMLRLPGSQGQASLIHEIGLALHVLDAADLRLLASGLRVRCSDIRSVLSMSVRDGLYFVLGSCCSVLVADG
jgi:hypothetical protein